jgi:hypothetical protein
LLKRIIFIILGFIGAALLLMLGLIAFLYFQNKFWPEIQANKIITALECYKVDRGIYPKELNELAPRYIKSIPSPKLFDKQSFRYSRGCEGICEKPSFYDPTKYALDYSGIFFYEGRYVRSIHQWIALAFVD